MTPHIRIEGHLNVRASGGTNGGHFTWTIYNSTGAIARSAETFHSREAARADAAFAVLTIKQERFPIEGDE